MAREKILSRQKVMTVLLAGGRSSRMGRDNKALLSWQGTTLVDAVRRRLGENGTGMVISANHDIDRLGQYGLPVITDDFGDYAGPLAGILAAMNWVQHHRPETGYILLCSCDTPFVPGDLLEKLLESGGGLDEGGMEKLVFPRSDGHIHPLHGLWPLSLRDRLVNYLEGGGRGVQQFAGKFSPVVIGFDMVALKDGNSLDPFANINTPEDYARCQAIASSHP